MLDQYVKDPQITVDGVAIDLRRVGSGRPLVLLQGLEGWIRDEEFTHQMAKRHEVFQPQHPGFGLSEFPQELRSVADIAQFYLAFLEDLDLRDVVLVGTSFGGWIAAEVAIRSTQRIGALVLVDSFGLRFSKDPTVREIQDIYAMSQDQVASRFYFDPQSNRRDVTKLPDHVLLSIARSREAMAFLGWKPYMHNPSLDRWLHRIKVPSLVIWGDSDGIVKVDYGRAIAERIPNSQFHVIERSGHYPHLERPDDFIRILDDFLDASANIRQSI